MTLHEPHRVAAGFFTHQCISDISSRVQCLLALDQIVSSNLLTRRVEQYSINMQFCMLPLGMYAQTLVQQDVASNNRIMSHELGHYYDMIKDRLSQYYGVECQYAANLQLPGFHIYSNISSVAQAQYSIVNYHQDRFDQLASLGFGGKIDSWVIPIMVPATGSGLMTDRGFYAYQPGDLIMWSGRVRHAVAQFQLAPGETRKTWQMHVVHDHDHGPVIFW